MRTIGSLLREPARRQFNAIFVGGAMGAYLSGGFGPWELREPDLPVRDDVVVRLLHPRQRDRALVLGGRPVDPLAFSARRGLIGNAYRFDSNNRMVLCAQGP